MAVIVILGAKKVSSNQITIGELLIFLTYLSYLYAPLQSISTSIGEAKGYIASAKRVFDIFDHDNSIKEPSDAIEISRIKGRIDIKGLSFAYDERPTLKDINLTIEPGQKVAFIGHSGSGKTTLLSLLPRFYEYNKGSITLDGVPIEHIKLKSLRQQFSIVTQDAPLLAASVADNIAFAKNDSPPTKEELVAAAKAANAYDFIMDLPQGFDTNVGERGSLLSGGQKQRIAIARAFLKNAPILLLDEPTSALDAQSEKAVVEALNHLIAEDTTTIIVSHALSTLKYADVIYIVDDGKIVSQTNYQDIGQFAHLLDEDVQAGAKI